MSEPTSEEVLVRGGFLEELLRVREDRRVKGGGERGGVGAEANEPFEGIKVDWKDISDGLCISFVCYMCIVCILSIVCMVWMLNCMYCMHVALCLCV